MHETLGRDHALITTETIDPQSVQRWFRLRKRLFVDECGWRLPVSGGVERDEFDHPHAEHCILFCDDEPVAGFRAIRTDHPYLSSSKFPQLGDRPFPRQPTIWEISRFGVLRKSRRTMAPKLNYACMFRFAAIRKATSLIAVADLTYERFLEKMAIKTLRYGPPQTIGEDIRGKPIVAVAGGIPLGGRDNPDIRAFFQLGLQLEVNDETHVLRRSLVSKRSAGVPAGAG